ncbi:16S rRNA (cytosine(1402)-N(4))-methyltransferase RsmH [Patescibacteria group bacterium]|nr:16S rRNA (cytosine(1402)-N(4))-methyltransferase RsmH [Patescibacteria group bacterium]
MAKNENIDFHTPVLLGEVLEYLDVKPGKKYIDATVGGGGHSAAILKKGGIILGIDQDPNAVRFAESQLALKNEQIYRSPKPKIVNGNFKDLSELAKSHKFEKVNGILFDLGFSTWQIKNSGRGFSFRSDEFLDMRMNPEFKTTAADLVNGLTKRELVKLFKTYCDEIYATRIAQNIIFARRLAAIRNTLQLSDIIIKAVPQRARYKSYKKIHPATQVFQALRIAVNDEINNLKTGLPQAERLLVAGGRLVVISFHSLEDRIVKQFLREQEKAGKMKILTKRPVLPSGKEIEANPSARSAKMRVGEKLKIKN